MKEKLSSALAVLAGAAASKACCILPALLSVSGLAGTAAAGFANRWLAPVLALVSLTLLGRSFYNLYVLRRGSRFSRVLTWTSAAIIVLVWGVRLAEPALAARAGDESAAPFIAARDASRPKCCTVKQRP
jgi:hypothetical protein